MARLDLCNRLLNANLFGALLYDAATVTAPRGDSLNPKRMSDVGAARLNLIILGFILCRLLIIDDVNLSQSLESA